MSLTTMITVAVASLVSFILAWFICRQTSKGLQLQMEREVNSQQLQITQLKEQKLALESEFVKQKAALHSELEASKSRLHKETQRLSDQVSQHQVKVGRLEAMLISERKRETEKTRDFQEVVKERASERAGRNQSEQRVKELETRLEEQQSQNQKALMQLQENKEALKQEFKHLAHEIFEARGKVLSDQHHEQLHSLLAPFREQLGEFRNKVEEAHREDSVGRAALKQQLETMHQLNRKMTDDAESLTRALKGDKKLQGSWGEMQVETILDSSGLIKGQEYEREPNFKDEEGQNRRPDFIVHLPEGKHLIIDSKVSLVDYMTYVNAETDADRDAAMARHIQCIRNHINSLNQKDYPSLPELKTPDFVFMFMPIEPSFIAAFQHDQQLFNEAFEKRIVVVTPTTLLATLRTVANLWTIERQNANTRKLADKGRQVYDKLRIFVEKMEKLDTQLGNARSTYDEAMGTLKHGRGNLISQADQFLALGVRVKKELPAKTLETADLEPVEVEELLTLEAEIQQTALAVQAPAATDAQSSAAIEAIEEVTDRLSEDSASEAVIDDGVDAVTKPVVSEPVADDNAYDNSSSESEQDAPDSIPEAYGMAEPSAEESQVEPVNTSEEAAEEAELPEPDLASLDARPASESDADIISAGQEFPDTSDFSLLESKLAELKSELPSPDGELPSLEAELARLDEENPEYSWPDYEQQLKPENSGSK